MPKSSSGSNKKRGSSIKAAAAGGEVQVQKSPAEFFAENQAIAGFDNLGKSLYTTIRELVENGLDACEAVHQLPAIAVHVREYTQSQFNQLNVRDLRILKDQHGDDNDNNNGKTLSPDQRKRKPIDTKLFQKKGGRKKKNNSDADNGEAAEDEDGSSKNGSDSKQSVNNNSKKKKGSRGNASDASSTTTTKGAQYFVVTVSDNGCGMAHKAIPDLFGRVLSGSKYGVRQTRGKFGLGAKMALIWALKSTGHPIHILTAHRTDTNEGSIPAKCSSCILDIDIYKNEPRIVEHRQFNNTTNVVGTTVRVLIAGNWTTYKSRIVQYLQQLAIITPYAALQLDYQDETATGKRNMRLQYDRRSEQMPATPVTIKHHPASVNNIIVQQLIQFTACRTLTTFLSKEFSSVSPALAKRLIAELAGTSSTAKHAITPDMKPSDLTDKQITRLVQLFHQVQLFRPPDGSCLSPLGEYNLNLGICKVLEPDLIATTRDKASAYEGHPFVIEAAVSLGGNKNVKEGVTVYRFANRIPLLFEGGADVATRVALTKVRWNSYKIDHKRDKVGVFVSIVSTKIPFKGTSKEYIGDDATEIHKSVKRALQNCCQQLRAHLTKRNALKDAKTRKSRLAKYVPDVSRSLFGLLDGMRKRHAEQDWSAAANDPPTKRLRLDATAAHQMIQRLNRREVTEASIRNVLTETIDADNPDSEQADADLVAKAEAAVPLYIVPLYNLDDPAHDICHPLFTFRPIVPVERVTPPVLAAAAAAAPGSEENN